jgi:hypothetical protein
VGADLNKIEKSEQLKRYLKALNNLILTDYLEFRWYINGKERLRARLADVGKNSRLIKSTAGEKKSNCCCKGSLKPKSPSLSPQGLGRTDGAHGPPDAGPDLERAE